jgi:predicted peptidase
MNRCTMLSLAAGLALTVLIASPPVAAQSPAPVETGFINGQVTANGKTMLYVVYVPRNYTPDKQWPVILFLHGGFTEGHDGFHPLIYTLPTGADLGAKVTLSTAGALGVAVMRNPQRFPCLVVWPQAPDGAGYWGGASEDMALRALEEVIQKYNGDRSRLYVTGLSLGGDGTWRLASDHPDLFAAALPIATSFFGPTDQRVQALKSMPLWVFHGAADHTTPPPTARKWVAALQAAGSTSIQYTELPGLGHNVWDIAYNDPKVIEWLLAQKR